MHLMCGTTSGLSPGVEAILTKAAAPARLKPCGMRALFDAPLTFDLVSTARSSFLDHAPAIKPRRARCRASSLDALTQQTMATTNADPARLLREDLSSVWKDGGTTVPPS